MIWEEEMGNGSCGPCRVNRSGWGLSYWKIGKHRLFSFFLNQKPSCWDAPSVTAIGIAFWGTVFQNGIPVAGFWNNSFRFYFSEVQTTTSTCHTYFPLKLNLKKKWNWWIPPVTLHPWAWHKTGLESTYSVACPAVPTHKRRKLMLSFSFTEFATSPVIPALSTTKILENTESSRMDIYRLGPP